MKVSVSGRIKPIRPKLFKGKNNVEEYQSENKAAGALGYNFT